MKFIFADSLDVVDPGYDFLLDENAPNRTPYWGDKFTHEMFKRPPYDGILMSRAMFGLDGKSGRLSESLAMRFLRVGAKTFYRLDAAQQKELLVFGDCGSFSYQAMETPPYDPTEMVEYYQNCGFTHGCSIDHIIFEYESGSKGSDEAHRRYDITLDLAEKFYSEHRRLAANFIPIGVAQGWSPESLATSTEKLLEIGYTYIAIGGLVPLNIKDVRSAVEAVLEPVSKVKNGNIHLLGFAKSEGIREFSNLGVTSFDSTSPFIRAFKDNSRNYWVENNTGGMDFFSAIRIPQAFGNLKLQRLVKAGKISHDTLLAAEEIALVALRDFASDKVGVEDTLSAILNYSRCLLYDEKATQEKIDHQLSLLRIKYERTLRAKPWRTCHCEVCQSAGVEVIIFRGSNRNKRRGMHNLHTFYANTKKILGRSPP